MTNEQKAKELGEKYIEKFFSPNVYSIERCLLDMAQWKDEQFEEEKKEIDEQWKRLMAESKSIGVDLLQCKDEQSAQEKQQWIEKAVIFLNERVCTGMSIPEIHNMIVDFRKSMEE
jgi:hypothetical protein